RFSTGNAQYYAGFLSHLAQDHPGVDVPAAVAIHPYLTDASTVAAVVKRYTDINPTIPAIVTEWNQDQDQDAIVPYQDVLSRPGADPAEGIATLWNSWFPWSTVQDFTTPGLVDSNGVTRNAGRELVQHLMDKYGNHG